MIPSHIDKDFSLKEKMKNDFDIRYDVVCIIELLTISFNLRRQVRVSPLVYPFITLSHEKWFLEKRILARLHSD